MSIIDIAIKEIGVEEQPRGSNWGEPVQKYLASVGINFPASWCMAYVYWCVREYCQSKNIPVPLFKSGGVLATWNNTSKDKKFNIPQPGDIFIMDFGKGLGHTGFVEKIENDMLHTVEGNTNDTGSREGYEVCRRQRKISSCKGFIRLGQL